jgi:hypothetical protein
MLLKIKYMALEGNPEGPCCFNFIDFVVISPLQPGERVENVLGVWFSWGKGFEWWS